MTTEPTIVEGLALEATEEEMAAPVTHEESLAQADSFLEATKIALEKLESVKDKPEFAEMYTALLTERAKVEAARAEAVEAIAAKTEAAA